VSWSVIVRRVIQDGTADHYKWYMNVAFAVYAYAHRNQRRRNCKHFKGIISHFPSTEIGWYKNSIQVSVYLLLYLRYTNMNISMIWSQRCCSAALLAIQLASGLRAFDAYYHFRLLLNPWSPCANSDLYS
jgi:hypothetical protein